MGSVEHPKVPTAVKTPNTFASLFAGWMQRRGLKTPTQAAPVFGCAVSTAYEYLNGTSLPPASRVALVARIMDVPERSLRRAIDRERSARKGG